LQRARHTYPACPPFHPPRRPGVLVSPEPNSLVPAWKLKHPASRESGSVWKPGQTDPLTICDGRTRSPLDPTAWCDITQPRGWWDGGTVGRQDGETRLGAPISMACVDCEMAVTGLMQADDGPWLAIDAGLVRACSSSSSTASNHEISHGNISLLLQMRQTLSSPYRGGPQDLK
jgi:hypothetical protein